MRLTNRTLAIASAKEMGEAIVGEMEKLAH
jgi:hypothetical protein